MNRPRTLLDAFCHQLSQRPHATALIGSTGDVDRPPAAYSWREIAARVAFLVRELETAFAADPSLPRRVGTRSDNSAADVVVALACMATSAIEVPIDGRYPRSVSRQLWRQVDGFWLDAATKERTLACTRSNSVDQLHRFFAERARRINSGQASLVLWTSGTTGASKGVTLSHRNLVGNAAAKLKAVPQTTDDVRLTSLPLCHAYARTCDLGTWLLSGGVLAVTLGIDGWYAHAQRIRPTLANVVPSIAEQLLGAASGEAGLDRLRLLGCGGAALLPDAYARWHERGVAVIQGYGLTEASPVVCSATPDDARAEWVGRPVDGWELSIREDGRLFVRGDHIMLGYWNDHEATQSKVDEQGWLDTCDQVERDPTSGQLRVLGRADEIVVLTNGNKVNPSDVERTVERQAKVRHALLVARGSHIHLWLDVDEQDFNQASFQEELRGLLASLPRWQQPTEIHRFDPPPSLAAGELTLKGTLRRATVLRRLQLLHSV